MLYQLGVVTMKVMPFNVDRVSRQTGTDYVEKPIFGAAPALEYVGEKADTFQFSGRLFPKKIGGLRELALLNAMRLSGFPQILVRGDGLPLGWVVITDVTETATKLAGDGVGQVVDVQVTCKTAGPPGLQRIFALVQGLFS